MHGAVTSYIGFLTAGRNRGVRLGSDICLNSVGGKFQLGELDALFDTRQNNIGRLYLLKPAPQAGAVGDLDVEARAGVKF